MKPEQTPLPLKIVAVITSLGMTLSLLGVICSLYYYNKATFYFSLFNFICWTIGGLIAGFIYLKVFDK
jgi:hypothetical protein